MSKNDITGDEIKTKATTKEYESGWDRIFGDKKDQLDYKEAVETAPAEGYDRIFKKKPQSLDAAYERRAMMQGLVVSPLFDENKELVEDNYSNLGTLIKEVPWPESEERIDVIGSNGNVGYTITEIDNSNPWCTKVTVEENKD